MKETKTRIRRKNGGVKKLLFFLILLFIVIQVFFKVILPASITVSRYVYRVIRNYYFNSKAFYFNSDRLSEDTAIYEADNWSGAEPYAVTINMNSRKNIEEVSKVNINYTIKYTCKVFKANGEEYNEDLVDFIIADTTENQYNETEGISKTIFAETNISSFDFQFSLKQNKKLENDDYVFVTVTAESTSPYKKTLKGTFKVTIGNPGMSYQIEDEAYSPYLNVIVTNTLNYYTVDQAFDGRIVGSTVTIQDYLKLSDENKAKCHSMRILLEFNPEEVVLDTTSLIYLENRDTDNVTYQKVESSGQSYDYVKSIKFAIDAEESRVIKFYKKVAANDYSYPVSDSSEPPKVNVSVVEN